MGEEPYFIDLIEKELYKTVLSEEERSFNQTIFYGKDTAIEEIVDAAKRAGAEIIKHQTHLPFFEMNLD